MNHSRLFEMNDTLKVSTPTLSICASVFVINVVVGSVVNVCVVWTIWYRRYKLFSSSQTKRQNKLECLLLAQFFSIFFLLPNASSHWCGAISRKPSRPNLKRKNWLTILKKAKHSSLFCWGIKHKEKTLTIGRQKALGSLGDNVIKHFLAQFKLIPAYYCKILTVVTLIVA